MLASSLDYPGLALVITSASGAFALIWDRVESRRNQREMLGTAIPALADGIAKIDQKVDTGNAFLMGATGARNEGERVLRDVPAAARTKNEQDAVDMLSESDTLRITGTPKAAMAEGTPGDPAKEGEIVKDSGHSRLTTLFVVAPCLALVATIVYGSVR